jgi:hypothetical protein
MNFFTPFVSFAKVGVRSSAFEKIYCLSVGISCHKYFDLSNFTWGKSIIALVISQGQFYSWLHHRVIGIAYMAYFLAIDCFFYSPGISWNPTACMFYFPHY